MITLYPATFKHRDMAVCAWTDGCDTEHIMCIDSDRAICVKMEHDQTWWIVASARSADEYFIDLGPYDTVDAAVTILRLTATKVEYS